SGSIVAASGLIGRADDRDVFKFATAGGQTTVNLHVAQLCANLDSVLELQNSLGKTVAVASPGTSLGASLSASLAAGTYYLIVRSSGGYGNLGRYSLSGSVGAAAT